MAVGSKQLFSGPRLNMFAMDPDDLTIIGLDTEDGPEHPLWDERIRLELDESLVLNMMVYGNIEPVTCRKNGEVSEVVAGRQRVRAGREANRRLVREGKEPLKIKVIGAKGEDGILFGISISENENRRDNGPLSKARQLGRYLEHGHTDVQASVAFGVSTTTVRNWKKLLNLAPEVIESIERGEVSSSAAAELSDLPRAQQVEKLSGHLSPKSEPESGVGGGDDPPGGEPASSGVSQRLTTKSSTIERRQRQGSSAAAKFVPPKMTAVRRALTERLDEVRGVVSGETLAVLQWLVGEGDGEAVVGLRDLVNATPTRGRTAEVRLSPAQLVVVDMIEECGGKVLESQLRKKTVEALSSLGVVERFEDVDGLTYVRRTDGDSVGPAIAAGRGEDDAEQVAQ